jgi:hypothetical protein
VAVLAASLGMPCFAKKDHTALDPKVIAAKSAYIENHGNATLEDEAYKVLKRWKRWEVAGTRVNADLVVVLSSQDSQSVTGKTQSHDPNTKAASKNLRNFVHLELIDAMSEKPVYSGTGKTVQNIIAELAKKIEQQEERSSK